MSVHFSKPYTEKITVEGENKSVTFEARDLSINENLYKPDEIWVEVDGSVVELYGFEQTEITTVTVEIVYEDETVRCYEMVPCGANWGIYTEMDYRVTVDASAEMDITFYGELS